MTDLLAFGLRVASDLPIPGAMPVAAGVADVRIVRAPDAPLPADAERPYALEPDGFSYALADVAQYRCRDGAHVTVTAVPGADAEHVAAMLIATVLPALLWARGELVLHASAAILPGTSRAIAIAGPSGSGKSTLLGRMLARGAVQVADDSIRVTLAPDSGAVTIAGLAAGRFAPLGTGGTPRDFLPTPEAQRCAAATLGAIAILTPGLTAPVRLHGIAALSALLGERHRPAAARRLGTEHRTLPTLTAIANTVPIVRWPAAGECDSPVR